MKRFKKLLMVLMVFKISIVFEIRAVFKGVEVLKVLEVLRFRNRSKRAKRAEFAKGHLPVVVGVHVFERTGAARRLSKPLQTRERLHRLCANPIRCVCVRGGSRTSGDSSTVLEYFKYTYAWVRTHSMMLDDAALPF